MNARQKWSKGDTVSDGYVTRSYNEDYDGYLNHQLSESDVPSLRAAYDTIALFEEVNRLRREVWHLKKTLSIYQGA